MSMTSTRQPEISLYAGRTERVPRPNRTTHPQLPEDALAHHQSSWDAAKRSHDENAKVRDVRLMKLEDEKQAKHREWAANQDAGFVERLRGRYLSSDPLATEADFQRDLGEIRRQARIAAAVNGPNDGELARQRQQAHDAF